MLVLLVCCLILNQGLRVDSVEFKDEVPITGTVNVANLKKYIDSKIQEAKEVQCPAGWLKYEGHCYYISGSSSTWSAAEQYCNAKGAHLIKLDNAAESAWIIKQRGSVLRAWIGLIDPTGKHHWKWVSDQSRATYVHWAPGEPNFSGHFCAEMYMASHNGKWNNLPCSAIRQFICEKS